MSDLTQTSPPATPLTPYSRKNPFLAELVRHDRLTNPDSLKDTRHFVLSLDASGITYTPGDSLGAFGSNSPAVVDELIALLEFDPNASVKDSKGQPTTFRQALLKEFIV